MATVPSHCNQTVFSVLIREFPTLFTTHSFPFISSPSNSYQHAFFNSSMSQRGPNSTTTPPAGRHPRFRGVRSRSGKWVSEIREPRKTTRIWLGTYPTPDMAAAAYDVAALALKGPHASLNFPDSLLSYHIPPSTSASDIRAAAAVAAASRCPPPDHPPPPAAADTHPPPLDPPGSTDQAGSSGGFLDEDELLNMPNLLVDMAEGLLVSPPRMKSPSNSDDSPSNSDHGLWSSYS